jgi:hypothetical protein
MVGIIDNTARKDVHARLTRFFILNPAVSGRVPDSRIGMVAIFGSSASIPDKQGLYG